jgi:3-deoxy-manno-octulosonate cytidylyltransferase (CMP-KDO synthetase)
MNSAVVVIPTRFASTRFPGKPLALIRGKPMIQWVWEAARRCRLARHVLIATDDRRIAAAAEAFGGRVVMTRKTHRSGTDRLAEVAEQFPAPIYINVQGDEPLLKPTVIDALIKGMLRTKSPMATLAHRLEDEAEWKSPEVVKVVTDRRGRALYFSRSPLPFQRTFSPAVRCWRHVGIYGYRAAALRQFVSSPPSPLEKAESLEQLRALENGIPILVIPTPYRCLGVDTPADLARLEALWTGSHVREGNSSPPRPSPS